MIVITAPTGQIGRQLLDTIVRSGVPVRVIARDPSRLPGWMAGRVEVVQGSHGDGPVMARALEGADALFWLVPPDPAATSLEAAYVDFTRPACEAIRNCGVRRVVGVSALGRGTPQARMAGLVTASLAMDDLIAATGAGYRSLAMPSFMDNLLRQAASISEQGVFSLPLDGDRKFPTCATRDIAAVAADLLLDPSWGGRADVPVLGPEDLSCNDMATIMSDVLERLIRFEPMSLESFKAALAAQGMSAAFIEGYADMYVAKNDGLDNAELRTSANSTPTSFRSWCDEVLKPAIVQPAVR
ncbi:NAD(P)H-binding protein [Chelativorans sp.]|uniref:NAD(P)H-binding protein n=1 Tax=Chelativorans sp. TaxID=2203393 RepID=UPI0028117B72|nr:NAD(P)H-binding protein [Chelativorans sp.]